MKKIVFCIVTIVFLSACNSGSDDKQAGVAEQEKESKPKKSSSGEGCGSMAMFSKGTEIEMSVFNSTEQSEADWVQVIKVLDTHSTGNETTSEFEVSKASGKGISFAPFRGKMKCDTKNIYIDLKTLVGGNRLAGIGALDKDAKINFLSYPLNMRVGQTFPDQENTFDMGMMKMKYICKNKTVEGRENITTAAGNWDCFKIKSLVSTGSEMNMKGKSVNVPSNETIVVEYFSPAFGVVKTETFSKNEKLLTTVMVTSIKK